MTESAGTLLYRRNGGQLEVLIVHPSGRYNRGAPWSIPKGKAEPGEDFETAARRETREETGVTAGRLHSIGSVDLARSHGEICLIVGNHPGETLHDAVHLDGRDLGVHECSLLSELKD